MGITMPYEELLAKQNGVCIYCKKHETLVDGKSKKIRPLCVEHDHTIGWKPEAFRGLACHACNVIVGYLENYREQFMAVIEARGVVRA